MNKTKIRSILFSIVCLVAIALSITAMVFGMLYCDSLNNLNVADAAAPVQQGLRFNQILNPSSFHGATDSGVNWVPNSTGFNLSGTLDAYATQFYSKLIDNLNPKHFYYFSLNNYPSYVTDIYWFFNSKELSREDSSIVTNATSISNIRFYILADTVVDFNFTPILIDLTYMFGEGKEPKTVEDVQKYLVPGTYYPYTPIVDEYQLGYEDGYTNGYSDGWALSETDVLKCSLRGVHATTENLVPNFSGTFPEGTFPTFKGLPFIGVGVTYFRLDDLKFNPECVGHDENREIIPNDVQPSPTASYLDSKLGFYFSRYNDLIHWLYDNPYQKLVAYGMFNTSSYPMYYPIGIEFDDLNKLQSFVEKSSAAYDSGFASGKEEGKNIGYDSGYKDGKKEGLTIGRDEGYKKGIEGKNSFTDLANSIVMVPVKGITSLFNFELFGFNVADLVLALLTMCIVFGIINLIMARRG